MKKNMNLPKQIEFDEAASQLLKKLETENKRIRDFFIRSYKGLPTSPEMEEETYNYFIRHSLFAVAIITSPSSSVITEFFYGGLPLSFPIDKYVFQSKSGKAVRARLITVERELPKIIEKYRSKGDVLIGNLGSGPGRDVINVFSTHYRDISNVRAIHIDKDISSLKKGRRIATIKGIDHMINFAEGNFLKYKTTKKFDIILLIGVLCSLKSEICIYLLKKIKSLLKRNGCLLVSNVSKKMLEEDPFTYFLMEKIGNWKLVFKDEKELEQIYKKAGYNWEGYFTDSYGFHILGKGTPRFYF